MAARHEAAEAAGIDKQVLHTLRHSFATHLLEQKTDSAWDCDERLYGTQLLP